MRDCQDVRECGAKLEPHVRLHGTHPFECESTIWEEFVDPAKGVITAPRVQVKLEVV